MRSWLLLFSCNLMWALQFTCIKLVQDQVGALFTVWGPMTLATLMLLSAGSLGGEELRKPGQAKERYPDFSFARSAVGVFPGQVFVTWGTRMSLASNAALLMLTLPVATAFLAFVFLHETMTPDKMGQFRTGNNRRAHVLRYRFSKSLHFGKGYLYGNMLIFLGTLGSAFYNSYGKKILERYSPTEMLFFTYVAMLFIMTPLTLAKEPGVFAAIPHFTLRTWIGLGLLTFFP